MDQCNPSIFITKTVSQYGSKFLIKLNNTVSLGQSKKKIGQEKKILAANQSLDILHFHRQEQLYKFNTDELTKLWSTEKN